MSTLRLDTKRHNFSSRLSLSPLYTIPHLARRQGESGGGGTNCLVSKSMQRASQQTTEISHQQTTIPEAC